LFLMELAASTKELGNLDQLPDSVEGVIAARIDRLDPEQRRVLRSASVMGATVDLKLFNAVMKLDGKGADAPFDRWGELTEFIVPLGNEELQFVHHLIRETAYEGLAYRRRTLLHARLAELIELQDEDRGVDHAALLSQHCLLGERYHAAWEYSRAAAEEARSVYANADAADFYRRALDAATGLSGVDNDELVDVCEALGMVYDDLGEFASAEDVLSTARRRVGPNRIRRAELALKTAIIRERTGQYAVALRWLSRALKELDGLESEAVTKLRGVIMCRYAWTRLFQGKPRQAISWATRAIGETTRANDKSTTAHCLEIIEYGGMGLGEISEESPALEALAIYEALEDVVGQASTLYTLGAREYFRGNWDKAVVHYQASEAAHRVSGSAWGTVMPMASRAEILSDQGHLAEADALAQHALVVARGANMENNMAFVRYILGRIAARVGDFEAAEALYNESRASYASSGADSSVILVEGLLAECHLLRGRTDISFEMATNALEKGQRSDGMETVIPLLQRVRGVSMVQNGDAASGRVELLRSLAGSRRRDALPEMAFTLQALVDVGAAVESDEMQAWRRELQVLSEKLGLVQNGAPLEVG
jgi:tetratricopeptide (TPR) repeat protein